MSTFSQLAPMAENDDSRRFVFVDAAVNQSAYDAKFARAFVRMIENPNDKGLMSTHLFYDMPVRGREFTALPYDARHILSGGRAWERRIQGAVGRQSDDGYWSKDQRAISFALQHGLVSKLPLGFLKLVSYGGGDDHAFRGNELQIVDAIFSSRREDIIELCAVDILERFAFQCAVTARSEYGIQSQGVIGDFIYNGKLAIPESRGTPIVMSFGGPYENTPSLDGEESPEEITTLAWAKLNLQHGLNTVVIKTSDTNQSPDLQNGPYAPTREFEAFLLSAFARAVHQGVIADPQYDVFDKWRMTSNFNQATKAVELSATCKVDHSVEIAGKIRNFTRGESRVFTLSHKWDEQKHIAIAARAGFATEIIRQPGNDNIVMVSTAVRRPDHDLMAKIKFTPR
jgi:hypothetical protein